MKGKFVRMGFCVVLLLVLTANGFAADGIDEKNKVISLAGYDACTGKYGDYGLDDKKGQEIAVEEINAAGGIQAGPPGGVSAETDFLRRSR